MFGFLKWRLVAKVEDWQRREIARLQQKSRRLKEELKRKTGKPVQLASEQVALLAEKARGIDPEMLKQISVFDPEEFTTSPAENDSTENRS
jgi:hypothetical protein